MAPLGISKWERPLYLTLSFFQMLPTDRSELDGKDRIGDYIVVGGPIRKEVVQASSGNYRHDLQSV